MKILVVGAGGREHALAFKAAQSEKVSQVFVAPGNAGTATAHKCSNVAIAADDVLALGDFAQQEQIDLTIVGPEAALCTGIVDHFNSLNLKCFGPSKTCAQLEGSKAYMKDFCKTHAIPTADYQVFSDYQLANEYLQQASYPLVLKADGLAAGKGVVIANDLATAEQCLSNFMQEQTLGAAGQQIVIEEFLAGREASFIVLCDGNNIVPLASAQDHKPLLDGNQGPNTGGMGAISPAPNWSAELEDQVLTEIIFPTVKAMADAGTPYTGFLYAGLMIQADGSIKLLEYNCRLGDPETQVILPRLETDLITTLEHALAGNLNEIQLEWREEAAVGVVMASGGYPGNYTKGLPIYGLAEASQLPGVHCFHAGTTISDKSVVTSGGRVLCVTALGPEQKTAQQRAYAALKQIEFEDNYYRTDIGSKI